MVLDDHRPRAAVDGGQGHGACIAGNSEQLMGRSRGGLTTKIHAVVDTNGLPVRLALTTGEAHDNRLVLTLLSALKSGAMLLADRGFDADWICARWKSPNPLIAVLRFC